MTDDILASLIEGHAGLTKAAADVSARYRERKGSLALQNATEALAYAATRMPATLAAVEHVLAQTSGDAPSSILDFGAGPGTATLAATSIWRHARAVMIETNAHMRGVAQKLVPDASFVSAPEKADIVMAAYVLNEMPDAVKTARVLWDATQDRLILIDTGTPAGYAMMMGVRDMLIAAGAHIHAPCPHHLECPYQRESDGWCHFSVRLSRTRLHKQLKGADLGYEDEKFIYLIAGRKPAQPFEARIVGYPRIGKVMQLPLCTSDGQLENAMIAKRDAHYKTAKKAKWGDAL